MEFKPTRFINKSSDEQFLFNDIDEVKSKGRDEL